MIAQALKSHQETVMRLAEVPGFGVDSAQQVIAEVGAKASKFSSAAEFTSWVGTCPGKAKVPKRTTAVAVRRAMARSICAESWQSVGPGTHEPDAVFLPLQGHDRHSFARDCNVVARAVLGGLHREYR
jgi:hypothetical protein